MNPRKMIRVFNGKMSLRNIIKYHRWLWWHLSMNAGDDAEKLFLFKRITKIKVGPTCFPCQMVLSNVENRGNCDFCPVDWLAISKSNECASPDGIWRKWFAEKNFEKRSEMAALICSIPVKKWNYGKYSW